MLEKNPSLRKAERLLVVLDVIKKHGPIGAADIARRLKDLHDFKDELYETIRRRAFSDVKLLLKTKRITSNWERKYQVPGSETMFSGQKIIEESGYRLEFPANRKFPWSVWTTDSEASRAPHFRLMIFDSGEPIFLSLPKSAIKMSVVIGRRWMAKNQSLDKIAKNLVDRYGQRISYLGLPNANFRIGTRPEKRVHYGNLVINFDEAKSINIERCHSSSKVGVTPLTADQAELLHAIPFSDGALSLRKRWWDGALCSLTYENASVKPIDVTLPVVVMIEPNFKILICDEGSRPNLELKQRINKWYLDPKSFSPLWKSSGDAIEDIVSQVENEIENNDHFLKAFPLIKPTQKAG